MKHRWVWCRSTSADHKKHVELITTSESSYQYTLTREDVGTYLMVGYTDSVDKALDLDHLTMTNAVGPILPGPPRILDFRIEGDEKVGGYARIKGQYIGGNEGKSEYWWIRITKDGKRQQITEPKPILNPDSTNISPNDPRMHQITEGKSCQH